MREHFIPRRAKFDRGNRWRDQRQLFILGLITIYEGLVSAISLGYLSVDTRAWYLFDVMD